MAKRESRVKQLARLFGGTWSHNYHVWTCDDGVGIAYWVGSMFDEDRLYPPKFYVYGYGAPKLLIGDSIL